MNKKLNRKLIDSARRALVVLRKIQREEHELARPGEVFDEMPWPVIDELDLILTEIEESK